jgi:hypothetical protein
MKKRYYIVEPLDIDGDKNPDGFLISQYRIDRNGNKIFLKNKYATYESVKLFYKNKRGGVGNNITQKTVTLTEEQFNELMNNKQQQYQQQPEVVIRNTEHFTDSMKRGFGSGLGYVAADAVGDVLTSFIGGMFN